MRRFEILRILDIFDACLTKFKNNQILLNKIRHRFLLTNKLGERASLILTLIVSLLSILSVGLSACPPAHLPAHLPAYMDKPNQQINCKNIVLAPGACKIKLFTVVSK